MSRFLYTPETINIIFVIRRYNNIIIIVTVTKKKLIILRRINKKSQETKRRRALQIITHHHRLVWFSCYDDVFSINNYGITKRNRKTCILNKLIIKIVFLRPR